MSVATAEKTEINWGIPLDRSNGAKPLIRVDLTVLYYTQPPKVEGISIPAKTLVLDQEKIEADRFNLSVESRRKRLAALNRGREILFTKYYECLGPAIYYNQDYANSVGIIAKIIKELSANQIIARRFPENYSTGPSHRGRLVRACG